MKVFTISDTHFGHENVIKYCNRPFNNAEEMDQIMIKLWNETVSNKDTVIHCGDFAISSKERIAEIVSQLNGKKILIKGNHDNYNDQFYKDIGFYTVSKFPIIYDFYIFSHEPLLLSDKLPYTSIYGHIHNDERYHDTVNTKCVCVERTNYRPVLLFEKH